MTRWILIFLSALLLLLGGKRSVDRPRRMLRAGLPILFEINAGQTHESVRFLARARGHTLFVTDCAEAVVSYKGGSVTMSLVGWPHGLVGSLLTEGAGVRERDLMMSVTSHHTASVSSSISSFPRVMEASPVGVSWSTSPNSPSE